MSAKKFVLHVEDEADHAFLVKRCFEKFEVPVELVQLSDGEQVLSFLEEREAAELPAPDLLLLDLRLPKKDGLDVLRELKSSEKHRRIPIVVLSTSAASADVRQASEAYANGYLVKPADLKALKGLMSRVDQYWLKSDRIGDAGKL